MLDHGHSVQGADSSAIKTLQANWPIHSSSLGQAIEDSAPPLAEQGLSVDPGNEWGRWKENPAQ